jgi:hypothetical protein
VEDWCLETGAKLRARDAPSCLRVPCRDFLPSCSCRNGGGPTTEWVWSSGVVKFARVSNSI